MGSYSIVSQVVWYGIRLLGIPPVSTTNHNVRSPLNIVPIGSECHSRLPHRRMEECDSEDVRPPRSEHLESDSCKVVAPTLAVLVNLQRPFLTEGPYNLKTTERSLADMNIDLLVPVHRLDTEVRAAWGDLGYYQPIGL